MDVANSPGHAGFQPNSSATHSRRFSSVWNATHVDEVFMHQATAKDYRIQVVPVNLDTQLRAVK
jgi:hypothetical protein